MAAELRIPTLLGPLSLANALAELGEAHVDDFARDLFDELKAIDEDIAAAFVGSLMDAADLGVA